jgi:predicted enzyme related to lactoylglutathione lyase
MALEITKDSIDLGIVVRDAGPMVAFYRDTLGLAFQAELDMPGGMKMYRFLAGTSVIKLVALERTPAAAAPPGGLAGGTGYRYFTVTIGNLEEVTRAAEKAGAKIAMPITQIRPNVRICMVADPEGNWVELLEQS